MKIRFDDKIVLITGAGTGIGRATAMAFAESGADVVINYRKSKSQAEEVVETIINKGRRALLVQADVSQKHDVEKLFNRIEVEFQGLDILINNAGSLIRREPFETLPEEIWDKTYRVNVKSMFLCTQAAIPFMVKRGGGIIINISSIAAQNGGGPGAVHYAAAKGAVTTLTRGLAKELIRKGIRVNGVAPGFIETPFHAEVTPPETKQKILQGNPLGRAGYPEEIAAAILFMASEASSYCVGEMIEVNGGLRMN